MNVLQQQPVGSYISKHHNAAKRLNFSENHHTFFSKNNENTSLSYLPYLQELSDRPMSVSFFIFILS